MREFEIKELFTINGQGGLFRFKANLRNNAVMLERLTDPTQRVVLQNKDMCKLSKIDNIGVYIVDQDDPLTLESVIETIYSMYDQEIEIPTNLAVLGDRWSSIDEFMEEVVPNHDRTKFKPYHMDKILKWFHEIVLALDMLNEALDAEMDATTESK